MTILRAQKPGGSFGEVQMDETLGLPAYRLQHTSLTRGNYLAKRAFDVLFTMYREAEPDLDPREIPSLKTFVTLSPAPSFRSWLFRALAGGQHRHRDLAQHVPPRLDQPPRQARRADRGDRECASAQRRHQCPGCGGNPGTPG